jgi:hypothetical protein
MDFLRSSSRLAAAALLAALLAGCQTDSTGAPGPVAQAAPNQTAPNQIPRHEAALECWQSVEKGRKDLPLDTRADIVTRCIDEKMQAVQAVPEAPEAAETSATVALPQPLPWQDRTKT